jgi:hypothetical protein
MATWGLLRPPDRLPRPGHPPAPPDGLGALMSGASGALGNSVATAGQALGSTVSGVTGSVAGALGGGNSLDFTGPVDYGRHGTDQRSLGGGPRPSWGLEGGHHGA